jgi:catechol 2,3-dioxygenase-like lactoylglutathione lyase family enzyme
VTRPALDHVAIGVSRCADAAPFLEETLGGRPVGGGPGIGFRFRQWEFARGGRIEIIEPDGPPGGFLHRFLARRGPGVHHVTFKVPRLEEATGRLEALGYEIVGLSTEHPAWKEAFVHPRQAQGIVIQVAESHPELEAEEVAAPPAPAAAGPPADVVALRLAAASAEAARRQWERALLGRGEPAADGLVFRWPGSPLAIHALLGGSAEPGPLGIEVAPRPGLALPEGPHPLLGTAFLPAAI